MKKLIATYICILLASTIGFAQVDRSQFPESGPAPEIKIADAETFKLDNGLKVFVVKNDKLPRVTFNLVLDRDPLMEGDKAGLTGFVGQMMMAGTKNRTKDQLDEEIDFIGASLSAGSTSIFASSLKKHQDKTLELMTDVLFNPVFPEDELEKQRKQTLTGLATSKDNPNAISSRLSSAMVYGKDHPYGEVTTEATVKNISVEDVKEYYNTFFKPNIAYLVIVGDMEKSEAQKVVRKYFSNWKVGKVPSFEYKMPTRSSENVVGLVDRSSSVQTVINIAQPVQLKLGDEDYIPSRLLNQILGGGSSSRLFVNLREDKGYTYGAYSSIGSDKLVSQISANASVRTEVTDSAVVEFLHEFNKIVDEGVTEEELEKAKANLSGSFGRSLESPSTIANFALNIERYNLPSDYYKTYLQKLNALTVADINATAKKLIEPDKLYITAVGNGSEIKDKLARFGEVKMYDNMGFPAKELTADADMTAEMVMENYLSAIGGKENARAIKTASISMEADVMGNKLTLQAVYDAEGGKYGQKTLIMGNVMQSTTILEDSGSISAQGQTMELTGEQFEMAKINSYLFPEAWYQELGYSIELDGLKDVEGTPAYKVIIKSPSGAQLVNYYSADSGLKIKNENPASGDTFYSEYQEKGGVLFPMVWTIKSQMIPVPLEAKITSLEINPELTAEDFQ
ncbi:Predicted Zn-dependent peptidase [Algoriphagus ornithinivorans]|uniref:Predicted Zn-dependent peptidase n=1 Tax=Algoriphagus ornithinivorans TaxID=226506 RepID=A0A1I5JBD5_9BACT|nr:pitrilysin family protein [Algoriphagus ornithinivorans]SFO70164.1 Predicted Zn-dependent peptidase [Algoriphagus ornithinivorans]